MVKINCLGVLNDSKCWQPEFLHWKVSIRKSFLPWVPNSPTNELPQTGQRSWIFPNANRTPFLFWASMGRHNGTYFFLFLPTMYCNNELFLKYAFNGKYYELIQILTFCSDLAWTDKILGFTINGSRLTWWKTKKSG